MRYEKGHKQNTCERIVDVASQRFRKDGVAAAGLAGIMTEAGLTNGAFYTHFESKESLVRESIASALRGQHAKLKETLQAGGIEAVIRSYLSISHLPSFGTGCPSAALLPEIGRESEQTRTTYMNGLQEYLNTLAENLPGADPKAAQKATMAVFSLMVGTLQIARSAPEASVARDILEGGVTAALHLIESLYKQ